jgi:hypothetical protein
MNVNLAWAIVALFLGAFFNRRDSTRRHAADVQAAREQAFEAMQRDTWLSLQDALLGLREAVDQVAGAYIDAAFAAEAEGAEATKDEPVLLIPTDVSAGYDRALLNAVALRSRLADDVTQRVVQSAIHKVQTYRLASARPWPLDEIGDERKAANDAVREAIEQLGRMISQRPEPPPRSRRGWPWRTSDTAS